MFECKKCGKVFSKRSNYNAHLSISNCVKNQLYEKYVCNKCSSGFSTLGNLNKHLRDTCVATQHNTQHNLNITIKFSNTI